VDLVTWQHDASADPLTYFSNNNQLPIFPVNHAGYQKCIDQQPHEAYQNEIRTYLQKGSSGPT
jgi:hypothetical protein